MSEGLQAAVVANATFTMPARVRVRKAVSFRAKRAGRVVLRKLQGDAAGAHYLPQTAHHRRGPQKGVLYPVEATE